MLNQRSTALVFLVSGIALAACNADDPAANGSDASPSGDSAPPSDDASPSDAAPPPDAVPTADAAPPSCVPDRAAWDTSVKSQVEQFCGACHGGLMPQYGAPGGFDDYDALLAPSATHPGARLVDRVAARAADGTMPPTTWPRPADDILASIVSWASCGAVTPNPREGLVASAPVFVAPPEAPADLPFFDLEANDYALAADALDDYRCFTLTAPVDGPRFIKRFEVKLEDPRIVHHVVLLRDVERLAPEGNYSCFDMPEGSDYLYAWAPGQDALEFPEGGLRVEPGDRYVLQIHYNNALGLPDVADNSGVRIFHGPAEGTEYGMVAIGPIAFSLPGRAQTDVQGYCALSEATTLLAGMPHMHTLGSTFRQTVLHADGTSTPLIELSGWDFEAQLFYSTPVTLAPGDRIETVCGFENEGNLVQSGARTQDEMCFNFAYVTPPPTTRYCDGASDTPNAPLEYAPGQCWPAEAQQSVTPIEAPVLIGEPAPLQGGALPPDGLYTLSNMEFWLPSPTLPLGELSVERTRVAAAGQLQISGAQFALDTLTRLHLALAAGPEFDSDRANTIAGTFAAGAEPSTVDLTRTCGPEGTSTWSYETRDDHVSLDLNTGEGGLNLRVRLIFTRTP